MDSARASETLILIVSQVLDICVYASSWGFLAEKSAFIIRNWYLSNVYDEYKSLGACALIMVEVNEDRWTITKCKWLAVSNIIFDFVWADNSKFLMTLKVKVFRRDSSRAIIKLCIWCRGWKVWFWNKFWCNFQDRLFILMEFNESYEY